MTYYQDLSPYGYLSEFERGADEPLVNVGWLDDEHSFPVGDPDPEFVERMAVRCASPVHLTRGVHVCQLCPRPTREDFLSGASNRVATPLGKVVDVGNGEIHVAGSDEVRLAAPTMVLHYVMTHHYAPPGQFVAAVMESEPNPPMRDPPMRGRHWRRRVLLVSALFSFMNFGFYR